MPRPPTYEIRPCEISLIPMERIQLTASTSLQGGKIPVGVINCELCENWENQLEREYVCCQEIDEAMTKISGEML